MKRIVMTLLGLSLVFAGAAQAQEAVDGKGKEAKEIGPKEEWIPLFNGKDLEGWTDVMDNASSWQVVGGALLGQGGGGHLEPAVLATERQEFRNFRLRVQCNYRDPGSGGVIEVRRSSPGEGVSSSYRVSAHLHPNRLKVPSPGAVQRRKDYRYGTAAPSYGDADPGRRRALAHAGNLGRRQHDHDLP